MRNINEAEIEVLTETATPGIGHLQVFVKIDDEGHREMISLFCLPLETISEILKNNYICEQLKTLTLNLYNL